MSKLQTQHGPTANTVAARPLRIAPMSETIGGEAWNFDVKQVSAPQLREIQEALLRHHMLVFHDQHMDNAQIEAFAGLFGEIEKHVFRHANGQTLQAVHQVTNLDANGKPSANPYLNANYYWHSDKAYLAQPAWITMLYGAEIPPQGGDTQFSDMTRAYDTLPQAIKEKIAGLRVVNSFEYMLRSTGNHQLSEEDSRKVPPVEHPLVRAHPKSGRKSLFVTMYAQEIVGMPPADGRKLLDELIEHAGRPDNVFTLKWRQNDLVFWDNRSVNHRAVANYDMNKYRRVLQRVVIRG